ATNISFSTFVLEFNFSLIQWRFKQIVRVHLHARTGGRADGQPIQPQSIAAGDPVVVRQGEEFAQGFLLAAVAHVALVFGDDQRQAGDFGGEVAYFDATEVGQRDVA